MQLDLLRSQSREALVKSVADPENWRYIMGKDKLKQNDEISAEELEQVSGGIGIINQNLNVLNTAYKVTTVATNFVKIESLAKK